MNAQNRQESENFLFDVFSLLKRRFAIFILTFLLVVMSGAIIGLKTPLISRTSTTLLIERPPITNEWEYYNEDNELRNTLLVLKSPNLLTEAIASAGIASLTLGEIQIKAVRQKDSNVVDVTMEDSDSMRLKKVFDTFLKLFVVKMSSLEGQKQDRKVDIIKSQIKILQDEMGKVDRALQSYLEKEEILSISDKLEKLNDELDRLRGERGNLEVELNILIEGLKDLQKRTMEFAGKTTGYDTTFQELIELKTTLLQLEREKIKMMTTYQESHPDIQGINEQVAFVKTQIEKKATNLKPGSAMLDRTGQMEVFLFQKMMDLETQEKSVGSRLSHLDQMLAEKTKKFKSLSTKLEEYKSLTRRQKVNEELHSSLIEKLNQAEIDRGTQVVTVKILSEPGEPIRAGRIDFKVIILVSILLGLLGGLVMANLQESIDTSLKTTEEAQAFLGLPNLGKIPDLRASLKGPVDPKVSISPEVVTFHQRSRPESEAFRSLRATLMHQYKKRPFKSLLITSGVPSVGKTTVLVNLAMAYAQSGSRVIIVDGDLRKPSVHHYFFLSNQRGLTDIILGERIDKVIQPTAIPELSVIPSGPLPPNPPELFASQAMSEIIHHLSGMADLVLFDMPPLLAFSDAVILAGKVDGVLLLVPLYRGNRQLALKALEQLRLVEAPVMGMITNYARPEEFEGYYYNYNYRG